MPFGGLKSVFSDMWKPYLKIIAKKAGQAVHVLEGTFPTLLELRLPLLGGPVPRCLVYAHPAFEERADEKLAKMLRALRGRGERRVAVQ